MRGLCTPWWYTGGAYGIGWRRILDAFSLAVEHPKGEVVPEITDDYMRDMLAQAKYYTLMMLKDGPQRDSPDRDKIVWEHGRRNFELRRDGVLAIVCPISDDSPWCGIGIFDAGADDVARIMDGDPGVRAGVFEYELHPVRGFPGSALPG